MKFITRHWFGLIISSIVFAYIFLFILILISPRQDLQKRGFIACTEKFIEDTDTCNGSWCMFKSIVSNSFCDFKIIGTGVKNWVKGEQKTPWSNYIFEPELDIDEEIEEIISENPEILNDLRNIKKLNRDLENKLREELTEEGFSIEVPSEEYETIFDDEMLIVEEPVKKELENE